MGGIHVEPPLCAVHLVVSPDCTINLFIFPNCSFALGVFVVAHLVVSFDCVFHFVVSTNCSVSLVVLVATCLASMIGLSSLHPHRFVAWSKIIPASFSFVQSLIPILLVSTSACVTSFFPEFTSAYVNLFS